MVRKMDYRELGEGQRTVLMLGTEGPVTRASLETSGQKRALHSLKRLTLIDKDGNTTEAGVKALRAGKYPIELDPIQGEFEMNVRALMKAWRVKRRTAIFRAVANAARAIDDEQRGE